MPQTQKPENITRSAMRCRIIVDKDLEKEKKFCKDNDWNEMTIDAAGGNVLVHVNGVKTAELKDDPSRPEGHFALQMHSGNVMHVMFKDIEMMAK